LIADNSCFKDVSLHFFQQYNPPAFVRLAQLFQKYANTYKLQGELNRKGGTDMSFYHDFGKKWSEFIAFLLHFELVRLRLEHTYEISDNAVVFRFKHNIEEENGTEDGSPASVEGRQRPRLPSVTRGEMEKKSDSEETRTGKTTSESA